jgi:hypothetical protein
VFESLLSFGDASGSSMSELYSVGKCFSLVINKLAMSSRTLSMRLSISSSSEMGPISGSK